MKYPKAKKARVESCGMVYEEHEELPCAWAYWSDGKQKAEIHIQTQDGKAARYYVVTVYAPSGEADN